MRTPTKILVALFILFIAACNNKNKVNLAITNAKDEVPSLGNLSFIFDKNLVSDSLLSRWDTVEYIKFSPPIRGRFRWQNSNELVFSPEYELPPATNFTAVVTDKITRFNNKLSLGKCEGIKFYTAPLQLVSATGAWNINEANAGTAFPQLSLSFNYDVSPDKLKPLLKIEVEGQQKNFNIVTSSEDKSITITVMDVKIEDKDLTCKVNIAKGLIPARGNTPSANDIETSFPLVSPFNLVISSSEANHDGTVGTVKLFTSQLPLEEDLKNHITITPSIKFKTSLASDGVLITSEDFDISKYYTIVVTAGLKGKIGGSLKDEYNTNIGFGRLEPSVAFGSKKAVYLSTKGEKNIEVKIVNVPRVKITISKIYENNLMAAQRYGYSPNGNYYYEDYDYEDGEYVSSYSSGEVVLGDIIYEKEIDTKTLPRYGNSRLFKFNVDDKLRDFKGIYHIQVRSTNDYWLKDSRFISMSDIGLIAKEAKDKIYVFANSIQSAEALSGVNVTLYGNNNQTVGTAVTDNSGVAEISIKNKEFSGFKAAMITARSGTDFNYMPFRSSHVETSRFDVGGNRANSTGLDAFVYSERDMYRPGEKMNLSVILRDWKWKIPGEVPLKMKLLLPNGKELKTLKKAVNDQGSLETQIELSPAAVTGSYSFEVYTGNDVLLSSKSILVEEFMPDRIKVTTSLDKKNIKPGEAVSLNINAMNLFGTPASGRNYEVEMQMKEKYFSPEKYNKFNFMLADRNAYYDNITREGQTDDKGNAKETFEAPAEYLNRGIIQADFFTTVFDETGRPVNKKSSIDIYTQGTFYGLGSSGYYYCALNQNISFPIIALNWDMVPETGAKAHIQVIKHDYRTVLSKSYSYFRYESQRDDKILIDQEVTVSGENTVFNFVPRTPGDYEVRIGKPGVNAYVKTSFYSYGRWGSSAGNFEVNNEGNIDIELDKKSYLTGETARVLFKTPFNGKMLVTIENDKVIEHRYVNVEKRSASVTFNLQSECLPNAYVTATLIKPHAESDMPLTVAHGFKSITVEEKARKIAVEIVAQKSVRSRTHQKVTIKAAAGAKVTLAVVDEGILQITGYKTPDPYGFFYSKRALEVNSFDLYPLLFPEMKSMLSSTGGDGFDLSKRTNPMQNKRVKLLSYWSGIMPTNGNGEASYEFDIPQFSGQVRLMAVSYKDNAFGSSEATMIVADPIVLSTALPRFLSPKDTVDVALTVSNTTDKRTNATANLKVTGPLSIVGDSKSSFELKPKSETRVKFRVAAASKIDVGKVNVEVVGMGEKFTDETDITVRPAASLQKITEAGAIEAGGSKSITFANSSFIPSSADYQLIISKNPAVELADQVYNLVNYPYGCTEQTVSAAFPQLYFGDLADVMKMNKDIKVNANYNVQEAIRKIKMRQLYSGAITLWDYEGSENWWASVYSAHFLQEAKKAGFEVPDDLLNSIYSYLTNRLKTRSSIPYYYNGSQKKMIAPKEVAYSLYVLAMAGKPQVSTMNYYKENIQMLTLDSRYLLSAAFALSGDKAKFKEMLPSAFAGEVAVKETGGSFGSDVRDEAIALNAVLEVDASNPQIGLMAKHVSQELKSRRYLSTQERAFGFIALGKIAREANKSNLTATVKVNGKQIAQNDGSTLKLTSKQLGGMNAEVNVSGTGKLYYFWQSEGISADGKMKEEDSYLKVRKRFFDRYGRPITNNSFAQNDLVVVAISLESSFSRTIENIVITDMLPAGFEVENPRTKEIPGMNWIKNESTPDHLDVRDDRVNMFVSSGINTQTYYYAVRAVSPGTYMMGPVMADAMYNGEYHSYNGSGVIRISEK